MGEGRDSASARKKTWETPRVISVERIPEVLGACTTGSTVRGAGMGKICTLGSSARGRCSLGTTVVPM